MINKTIVCFIFLVNCATGFCQDENIEKAKLFFAQGKINESLANLHNALKENPENKQAYMLFLEIVPENDVAYGRKLLEITQESVKKGNQEYRHFLGLCKAYRNLRQYKDSLSNCRKALETEPAEYSSYRELGLTYLESKKQKKAIEMLQQGVEISSDNYKSYYFLGTGYFKISNFQDSRKNFEKSLELAGKKTDFDSFWYRSKMQFYLTALSDKIKEKRGQKAEDRGQKAEDRGQKIEDRGQKAEDRGQKIEDRGQKIEDRQQKAESFMVPDSDILNGLKERQAVEQNKSGLSPDDILLFKAISDAEKRGAVDYLKTKFYSLSGYTVEKKDDSGRIRLLLNLKGYQAYLHYITQDAIKFFESKGVRLSDVFLLRDTSGRPVFDKSGKLTYDGQTAYWKALDGDKTWILPTEPVPTPEVEQKNAEIDKLLNQGYREISEPEFYWLLRATDCPLDILTGNPFFMKIVQVQQFKRYFICYIDGSICSALSSLKLAFYIENYRMGNTSISEGKATRFFGKGKGEARKLCHDGKVWMGD